MRCEAEFEIGVADEINEGVVVNMSCGSPICEQSLRCQDHPKDTEDITIPRDSLETHVSDWTNVD